MSLAMLKRAVQERDSDLISVRWDPLFDPIRNEPDYHWVVQKLGFE